MSSPSNPIAQFQPEAWTSAGSDALKVFITDPQGAVPLPTLFTYPIFGDSETIYGYRDLVIFVCFDHHTFKPFLNVKYSEKLDDPEIVDLKAKLLSFLPKSTIYKDEGEWVDLIAKEKETYSIPGVKYASFSKSGTEYDIYKINLKEEAGLELHLRLQILVLLFIEAGTYIDAGDELWEVYVLYEKNDNDLPSIVGFSTAYNYWKYPGHIKFDNNEVEIRKKISQFIIFPTHQGQGLGQKFYSSLYSKWLEDSNVTEVVIEDPNEGFDDLRDRADLQRLKSSLNWADISTTTATPEWILEQRAKLKLEKRQFSRLIEMILLYKLKNKLGLDTKKDVRLFIKRRIFEKNKEGLSSLDDNTKKDKLQTAYLALEEDYYRILDGVKFGTKRAADLLENDTKRQK